MSSSSIQFSPPTAGAKRPVNMKPVADDVQTVVIPGVGHWVDELAPDRSVMVFEHLHPHSSGAEWPHSEPLCSAELTHWRR